MVTRTWTGPQRVWIVSPVTVFVPVPAEPLPLDALALPEGAGSARAACGEACGFSDSSITIPETVAALASTIRRSGRFFFSACTSTASQVSEFERLVVDAAVRHPGGAQRLVHLAGEPVRPAHVDVPPGEVVRYGGPQQLGRHPRASAVRPVEQVVHPRSAPARHGLQLPAQRQVFDRARPVQEGDLARQ